MANFTLEVNYRAGLTKGRANSLRREGWVTGNVFGHNADSIPVEVNLRDLVEQVKASPAGLKSLIDLKIKDAPEPSDGTVIIKSFHKDPVTRRMMDVQFQRVQMKEKLNIGVPVVLVGESPGTAKGGILEQGLDELQITCLPGDIPPQIEVDVSGVDVGQHISVSDLDLGDQIEIQSDSNAIVAASVAHRMPGGRQAEAEEEAETEALTESE